MNDPLATHYLEDMRHRFRSLKEQADRALAQVHDDELHLILDPEANSLALLIKHIAGNMQARWRAPFDSDGERERNRDREFEADRDDTRAALTRRWETGWQALFGTLRALTPDDLLRTIQVRGRSYSVVQALNRQLAHYAAHVGQIVFLAKHHRGSDWQSLSIPRRPLQTEEN
jgi:hypothetical protein